jgi:DNA polymerase-4
MRKNRKIIHLDLDAFYCAVEELLNPSLKGKPFAVGGSPEGRGVVTSCSYAARIYGVRSAMPAARAIQLCPEIIMLPGRRKEYSARSRQVMSILYTFTQRVEQISIDEAFLNVSEIKKEPFILTKQIQNLIMEKTMLPCSMGMASNKLIAKIATDVGKSTHKEKTYPKAIQIVPSGEEASFLAPLPTEMLWGIGKKTANRLGKLGIHKIGELAIWPKEDLVQRFGDMGRGLHLRANGIDHREVNTHRTAKSISQEVTFREDCQDIKVIHQQIEKQSNEISKGLKKRNLFGNVVKLKIRWPDFTTITRQITLPESTNNEKVIIKVALKLLRDNWKRQHPIRLIGVGVSGFHPPKRQLSLWDQVDYEKLGQIESVLNEVKMKFGESSINRGLHEKVNSKRDDNQYSQQ